MDRHLVTELSLEQLELAAGGNSAATECPEKKKPAVPVEPPDKAYHTPKPIPVITV